MKLKLLFFVFVFFLFSVSVFAQDVVKVDIKGLVRTDKLSVMDVIKTKVGGKYSIEKVDNDIRCIYSLGFYNEVKADVEDVKGGKSVAFILKEKPSIRFITFVGNKRFKDKELLKNCETKAYRILTPDLVTESIEKMKALYTRKGRYLTEIFCSVKSVLENRVDIKYTIHESKKVVVRNINIIGNEHIKNSVIEKAMVTHKKHGPYILTFLPWFYTGRFNEDAVLMDKETVRDVYLKKGYAEVSVKDPIITVDVSRSSINMDISLEEGQKYTLKNIEFKGEEPYSIKFLKKQMKSKEGKLFNGVAFRQDIMKITDLYGQKGYAFCDVKPIVHLDKEDKTIDVALVIDKRHKIYVDRIEIVGNEKTRDNVIRRVLKLKERDLYNSKYLRDSRRGLYKTDYFKEVTITTKRVDEKDKLNARVAVKEKHTGSFNAGVGYGTFDKFSVMGSVMERNLLGTGLYTSFSGNIGSRTTLFDLTVTQPWLSNKPISLSGTLYNSKYDYTSYDEHAYGGRVTLAHRFFDNTLKIGSTYGLSFEKIDITELNPSKYLKDQEGRHIESYVIPFIERDTLDSSVFPTSGALSDVSVRVAGLGGTERYAKTIVSHSIYYKLLASSLIAHVRGEAGYATGISGKHVPIQNRFFLGGIDSVRGFSEGKISPKDDEGNCIGGEKEIVFNFELIFPILTELNFYGVAFYDMGNCWRMTESLSDLRKGAGLGLRWISPLGPMRIEWGKNLSPEGDEKGSVWHFTMGMVF